MAVPRRILVTGATGFIGRRTVPKLLDRGFEVHAVSRRSHPATGGGIWHATDLRRTDDLAGLLETVRPTHLLHLAWETAHGRYYDSPENLLCLRDGVALAHAFAAAGGTRIVAAGSSAEYELGGSGDLVEDGTPLAPNGLYGACKKALFEVVSRYSAEGGFTFAWARVFFCYGPGEPDSRLIPTLARELRGGAPVRFQEGRGVRDYVHVDDVAEAFAVLADSSATGAFNVGSGQPILLRDVAAAVAETLGRSGAIEYGAVPTPSYEPARVVADTTRLRSLGWRPMVTLAEGLRGALLP